jgi:hypothetical protein
VKIAETLEPKGKDKRVIWLFCPFHAVQKLSGRKQAPNLTYISFSGTWKPHIAPDIGKVRRKTHPGQCEIGILEEANADL